MYAVHQSARDLLHTVFVLATGLTILLMAGGCDQSPSASLVGGAPDETTSGGAVKSMMAIRDGDDTPVSGLAICLPEDVLTEWRSSISAPGKYPMLASEGELVNETSRAGVGQGHGHPVGVLAEKVNLGRRPFGVAVSRDGLACVTLVGGSAVVFLDTESATLSGEVTVGSIPTSVAFDPHGETVYVTSQSTGNVDIVDVASRTLVDNVELGGSAIFVAFAPNGKTVYASNNFDQVAAIDAATHQIKSTVPVGHGPNGIAMQSGQRLLFTSCFLDGTIHVIDRKRFQPLAVIETGVMVQDLAVSRNGHRLYAANEYGSFLTLDLDEGTISSLPLEDGAFGMALTPDHTRAYLGIPDKGDVVVVLLETMEIESTIHVGGRPRRIAFTRSGDCAVVADESGYVCFIR
jgi:YVTN family beta-propeller protein